MNPNQNNINFDNFPNDVKYLIGEMLDKDSAINLSITSKQNYQIFAGRKELFKSIYDVRKDLKQANIDINRNLIKLINVRDRTNTLEELENITENMSALLMRLRGLVNQTEEDYREEMNKYDEIIRKTKQRLNLYK